MTNGGSGPTVLPVVDLADLFAMPLTALIDADADAARTFIAFIKEYGFEKPASGDFEDFGKLRMVEFSYTRLGPGGAPQRTTVEIPLILLIPLPALAVHDATMRFDVEVFGVVERSKKAQEALDRGDVPEHQRPVSRRPRQLKVRMARDTGPADQVSEEERAEARSKTTMAVEVNLRQSDLPQGILQLINLTAQGTQDSEVVVPYFVLSVEGGTTTLRSIGQQLLITLTFVGLPDTRVGRRHVRLSQGPEDLFSMPSRVTTDEDGRARFNVELDAPPTDERKVLQTITAHANVDSGQYGMLQAEGLIRIQVDMEGTEA